MRKCAGKFLLGMAMICLPLTAAAQESYDYNLKLGEGETYQHEISISSDMTQEVQGMPQELATNLTYTSDITVGSMNEAGNYTLTMEYTRVQSEQSGMGQKMAYDSSAADAAENPMASSFGSILGTKLNLEVTPEGEVVNVTGFDDFRDRAVEALKVPEGMQEQAEKQLEQVFSEDMFNRMFAYTLNVFPEGEVSTGESWTKARNLGGAFPLDGSFDYTLEEVGESTVTVAVKAKYETPEGTEAQQMGGMSMKPDLSGSGSGTVTVDRATGMTKKYEMTQDNSGNLMLEMQGQSMEIPLTSKTKTVATLTRK